MNKSRRWGRGGVLTQATTLGCRRSRRRPGSEKGTERTTRPDSAKRATDTGQGAGGGKGDRKTCGKKREEDKERTRVKTAPCPRVLHSTFHWAEHQHSDNLSKTVQFTSGGCWEEHWHVLTFKVGDIQSLTEEISVNRRQAYSLRGWKHRKSMVSSHVLLFIIITLRTF